MIHFWVAVTFLLLAMIAWFYHSGIVAEQKKMFEQERAVSAGLMAVVEERRGKRPVDPMG